MANYFVLLEPCKVVKGTDRCALYDLQRERLHIFPDWVGDFLEQHAGNTSIEELRNHYSEAFDTVRALLDHLVGLELVHITAHPQVFAYSEYEEPYLPLIENAIVDFNATTTLPAHLDGIAQIVTLGCEFLVLRFFDQVDVSRIERVLTTADLDGLRGMRILASGRFGSELARIDSLLDQQLPIQSLELFGTDRPEDGYERIVFHRVPLGVHTCGAVAPHFFRVNRRLYHQSQRYNSCLHQKIGIDQYGFIKNCPSCDESLGHLASDRIADVLPGNRYAARVRITKDETESCKNCIFRHACTDCRAFLEHPDDLRSKPLKCGYDPTTHLWSDWREVKTKHRAREHYGFEIEPTAANL